MTLFRPDRARSRVLVIGASTFANLPNLPQVEAAAAELSRLLHGDPKAPFAHGWHLRDPYSPADVTRALFRAAREATDVLFVYYIGHGLIHQNQELYLAVESSSGEDLRNSAVALAEVYAHLADSRASVKVLILDCCHSGLAQDHLPGPLTAHAAVLTSTPGLGL